MNDTVRRVLRTLIQTGSAGAIIGLLHTFNALTWTAEQVAAATTALTAFLSFLQNAIEEKTGKAILVAKQDPE